MSDTEILTRRFERERAARKQAEALIEQKSRELYLANQELLRIDDLSKRRFHRERAARKEAEAVIEQKSREIYFANIELNKVNENLKEIDRMKTDFLSNVSHELRTPLTSILGFSKIIKKKLEESVFPSTNTEDRKTEKAVKQVNDNINIIISESVRLTNLINDVLDIAKMEAGKIEWRMDQISINDVIDRGIAATTSLFANKSVELFKEVPDNLPVVVGDSDRLIQVVINIISNAVKFTDEGSVTCRARINDYNEIMVSITDTGSGIVKEDQPKVFEKFKQVGDTLTDKPHGTGLGLPICKEILHHHEGRIWVDSEIGKGSTFFFTLPIMEKSKVKIKEIDWSTLISQLQEHRKYSPTGGSGKKTILVTDDEENIRQLLPQELEASGFNVTEAISGIDAIEKVKSERPDLIIMDIMMPGINGFDAIAVLKNDPLTMHIPIMILSVVEDKERGFHVGVDSYLTKPIDVKELNQEVIKLLSQGASRKKVLIVDENESTVKALAGVLEKKGHHVVESLNGEDCITRAREINPDLIIIDSFLSDQHEIVKTLHYEKGLENVLFFILDNGTHQTAIHNE